MDIINLPRLGMRSTSSRRADQPPTATLPPLIHLATYTTEQIQQSLQSLQRLYFQPKSTIFHVSKLSIPIRKNIIIPRPVHDDTSIAPDSGYASAEEDEIIEEDFSETSATDSETFYEDTESDTRQKKYYAPILLNVLSLLNG